LDKTDIGIIGAGVIGCAIARDISRKFPGKTIKVIERHSDVCMETSRFNSGVNHSGFHQKPGSLKAELALRGSRLMEDYVTKNLPEESHLKCGMLIAISKNDLVNNLVHDIPSLIRMFARGKQQEITLNPVGPSAVKEIEPNISALGGIFIPQISVIDPVAVTRAFKKDAIDRGVGFFFQNPVRQIVTGKYGYTVQTENNEFFFKVLINAAGLYADDIACLAGVGKYTIYPWRGEYYELVGLPKDYVRTLVYPSVSKNSPGKGIHFRPRMNNKVLVGPSAMAISSKNDYDIGRYPKEVFLKAAQKFFPDIKEDNLVKSYAGIRPKLSKDGKEDDFIISVDRNKPPLINLVGIESPGLSSSMAIAEYVSELLSKI
jgi:glycerol-3-phosphate dehydrogenase